MTLGTPAPWRLAWLILLAFLLRVGFGIMRSGAEFLANGYTFYVGIADSVLRGEGFCMGPGYGCALRVPVYPLVLVPLRATSWFVPATIAVQAAIGSALVWLTWKIGNELCGASAGAMAAALSFVPVAVVRGSVAVR